MIIEFIETGKGNELLEYLKKQGWRVTSQYNPLAFDKGIDHDHYELVRGDEKLLLEWSNWFEWQVTGSSLILNDLKEKLNLS